jgi:hypothetical protein
MNNIALYDFKIFLKKNLTLILSTGGIVFALSLILVLFSAFSTMREVQTIDEVNLEEGQQINDIIPFIANEREFTELSEEQQSMINDYLEAESYSFRFAIENEDSTFFTQTNLLETLLINEFNFNSLYSYRTEGAITLPSLILGVNQEAESPVLTISISSGNKEANSQLANFYYDLISEGNLSLLSGRTVYMLDEYPVLSASVFNDPVNYQYEPIDVETFGLIEALRNNLEQIVIVGIIGIIGGLGLGLFLSVVKDRFGSVVSSIDYLELKNNQELVKLDAITNGDSTNTLDAVITNLTNKSVIIIEDQDAIRTNALVKSSSNIVDADINGAEEVIIMVECYGTHKKWLVKQLESLKMLDIPTKIIRISPVKS